MEEVGVYISTILTVHGESQVLSKSPTFLPLCGLGVVDLSGCTSCSAGNLRSFEPCRFNLLFLSAAPIIRAFISRSLGLALVDWILAGGPSTTASDTAPDALLVGALLMRLEVLDGWRLSEASAAAVNTPSVPG